MAEPYRFTVAVKRRYFWENWDDEILSPNFTWEWEVSVLELSILHRAEQGLNLDDVLDQVGEKVKDAMVSNLEGVPEQGFVLVIGGIG